MSISARLDKLMPALSVRERVSLILRAQAAGEDHDPELSRLTSLEQRQEYDRYMALFLAANFELGTLVFGLEMVVGELESSWADCELLTWAGREVAQQDGETPPKPTKTWRRLKEMSTATLICNLGDEVRRRIAVQAEFRFQELQAIEATWKEIADQFDGEDPRDRELREKAMDVSARLRELVLKASSRRQLPVPTEAMLADMNERVEHAFRHFNVRVTRP
ncbi:MAG: hypothetical protein GEU75_17195 [Dehalococcoidia bacterium]|nr:hypothetical protein [Dehalococcoidia bacterium]